MNAAPAVPSGAAFWWRGVDAPLLRARGALALIVSPTNAPRLAPLFRLIGGMFRGLRADRLAPAARQPQRPLMVAAGFGLLVEPVFASVRLPTIQRSGPAQDAWAIPLIALLLSFRTAAG